MSISTIRHDMIFNASKFKNMPINIIGVGATGSRIWLSLVELGLTNIKVFDFDYVEPHNLANQIYLTSHVGQSKVDGLKDYYKMKTGMNPPKEMEFFEEKIQKDSDFTIEGVLFLLTDTMESRKEIYDNFIEGNNRLLHVIETRMASSYGNVNTFDPYDSVQCERWVGSLINDEDAEVSPCGASISVGPTASIIANMAVWQFIHLLTNPEASDEQALVHLKPFSLALN